MIVLTKVSDEPQYKI